MDDPAALFNSSLDGNVRAAIDIHEGEEVSRPALPNPIRAAVALSLKEKSNPKTKPVSKPMTRKQAVQRMLCDCDACLIPQEGTIPHWVLAA